MKIKITTNSQLSTNEPEKKRKKETKTMKTETKQTTTTGTESEKWTSCRGFSVGRGKGEKEGKRYREEEA